jgi:hypothetical protein
LVDEEQIAVGSSRIRLAWPALLSSASFVSLSLPIQIAS